mmetsp:Transcript_6855/g.22471  ORF Transcript_6855/g.22471 Transcript_6855/m.22471 type:complete len:368 (+) Transcript_6855:86-1189(+)
MAIGSEGTDLVAYMLLFIPLEFLMTSRRVNKDGNRTRAVAVPMTVLVLFAAIKIGYQLTHKEPSYYDMLEVLPNAPYAEIKKGYRRMSLKVHPDKVMGENGEENDDASEEFRALKAAYDVLNDVQLRDLYNKFGPPGVENKDDTSGLLAGLGFFYVTWLAVAYLVTQSKAVERAQTWAFTGLLALGIFEYQATILSFDFLEDQLPQLAMFEKIELLHRVYPVFLLGARMVAWLIYQDVDTYNALVLQRLHAKTDVLLRMTRENHITVFCQGRAGMPALPAGTAGAGATGDAPWGGTLDALDATPFRPLHAANTLQGAEAAAAAKAAAGIPNKAPPQQQQQKGGRSMTSLIYFFGVYFFFQWLVGRGQ